MNSEINSGDEANHGEAASVDEPVRIEVSNEVLQRLINQQTRGRFMQNFDPDLVGTPSEPPIGYIEGETPKWDDKSGRALLYDPIAKMPIAYWDYKFKPGQIFFFERGFLRVNPENSGEWTFVMDPKKFPYKAKKSKAKSLINDH